MPFKLEHTFRVLIYPLNANVYLIVWRSELKK